MIPYRKSVNSGLAEGIRADSFSNVWISARTNSSADKTVQRYRVHLYYSKFTVYYCGSILTYLMGFDYSKYWGTNLMNQFLKFPPDQKKSSSLTATNMILFPSFIAKIHMQLMYAFKIHQNIKFLHIWNVTFSLPFYHPLWMNSLPMHPTAFPESETIFVILQSIFYYIPLFCLALWATVIP